MDEKATLIASLVQGVGDIGNNSGAIAQLLGKILARLLQEMKDDAGCDASFPEENDSKKSRRRRKQHEVDGTVVMDETTPSTVYDNWLQAWIQPFAFALLSSCQRRRSQVAAFCLPLVVPMCIRRSHAPFTLAALMLELNEQSFCRSAGDLTIRPDAERSSQWCGDGRNSHLVTEVYLWAFLECAQYASSQKLIVSSPYLRGVVSKCLPLAQFKASLTHSNGSLRIAGFLAIDSVVPCYVDSEVFAVETEVALWREALPYASKSNEKGYTFQLLTCLSKLLRRLYASNCNNGSSLRSFVCDFLIKDLALQKGAYPGTVSEKEFFTLSLLKSIYSFGSGVFLETSLGKGAKEDAKQDHRPNESVEVVASILKCLVQSLSSLFSLVHSVWDATRNTVFELMRDLVRWALENSVALPDFLVREPQRVSLLSRAIHLASSPRQREADSGAKILGLLYITASSSANARSDVVKRLASLLIDRLDMTESVLTAVVTGDTSKVCSEGNIYSGCLLLPLAHGLFHALNIIMEQTKQETFSLASQQDEMNALCRKFSGLCCRAVSISLSIVADVEHCVGDEDVAGEVDEIGDAAPLNVNTGALGANTSFAALTEVSEEEDARRLGVQRIVVSEPDFSCVCQLCHYNGLHANLFSPLLLLKCRLQVGSWLLTKEACAALATIFSAFPEVPPGNVVEALGELLISALISLKHQGGAFAAHKALQSVSESCCTRFSVDPTIQAFPSRWISRLLYEVSSRGTVKNSTLRRSTGYALGFLSILRTEPTPRSLGPFALASLIRLSLPPKSYAECSVKRLGVSLDFAFLKTDGIEAFPFLVLDSQYEVRMMRLWTLCRMLFFVTFSILLRGWAFACAVEMSRPCSQYTQTSYP